MNLGMNVNSARSQVFVYLCASRLYVWLHRGRLDKGFLSFKSG